ncbi:MAG TPA: HD domain-containing phosphohydrolase, partial [Dehalococcoidia bacterium]|nr:HD domain-containing phosphohydrolase [Dehalococcoidia bacterium]
LATAGSYVATNMVTGSLSERFDNRLAEAGRVVSDAVVRKERDHLETVRAVAFTEGVADAVVADDAAALSRLVGPLAANGKVERLEVLNSSGQRIKTLSITEEGSLIYEDLSDSDDPTRWPLVQKVIQQKSDQAGDKYAQIVETSEGFVFYTAGPIHQDGNFAGVVLVGTMLDSFVVEAKTEALADVTVYDFDGNPLASTYGAADETGAEELNLVAGTEVLDAATAGDGIREDRSLWGRDYSLVYGRLTIRDEVVGLYSAGLSRDFMFSAGSATRTRVAVVFGLGMAAVLGIGLFVAYRLTQPILRLVRTARLVTSGDLTARSGIRSRDEIGTLASSFDEMTEKLRRQHLATIKALTSAIDARDPNTMGHSMRVGQLAVMIGRQLDLEDSVLARLEIGGYLHDIGKIGIRDAILLKPGSLSPEERGIIQEHPRIGLAILDPVELADEVLQVVGSHHERLDGSGYPDGLHADDVPVAARIAAIADVYDAVTNTRPYRKPMQPEKALAMLRSDAGKLFDHEAVEALAAILDEWTERCAVDPQLLGFKLPDLYSSKVGI